MTTYKSTLITFSACLIGFVLQDNVYAQSPQELRADIAEILKSAQRKVEFYGRVVDQGGAPIGGVLVSTTLLSLKDPTGKGDDFVPQEDILTLRTDANGLFQVTGKTGTSLIVDSLAKEGYIAAPLKQVEFDFDPADSQKLHKADQANPVVFTMWHRQGKTNLVAWDSPNRKMPQDGSPIILDIVTCKIGVDPSPLSGFRLRLDSSASAGTSRASPFPWKFSLEAVSGGIVPTNDELMYLAPEAGYVSTYTFSASPTDTNWSDTLILRCYYKSANGKIFGRFELKIIAIPGANDGIVAVKSAVNMNGSTNLEP